MLPEHVILTHTVLLSHFTKMKFQSFSILIKSEYFYCCDLSGQFMFLHACLTIASTCQQYVLPSVFMWARNDHRLTSQPFAVDAVLARSKVRSVDSTLLNNVLQTRRKPNIMCMTRCAGQNQRRRRRKCKPW